MQLTLQSLVDGVERRGGGLALVVREDKLIRAVAVKSDLAEDARRQCVHGATEGWVLVCAVVYREVAVVAAVRIAYIFAATREADKER